METRQTGFKAGLKKFLHWTKVVLLVILITLLIILILQNLSPPVRVKFIVVDVQGPVAFIVFFSFITGVGLTLLALLLRRGASK